ncbi:MAG: ABC transporter permease [Tissierellia bacterium]|nr:ABC transporter permease [Tissierellia bacterium]
MLKGFFPVLESSVEIGLIFSLLAIGVVITYKILDFYDLSVEGTFPLGAFVFARLALANLNPIIGIIVSFFAGTIAGSVTYFLYKKFKIEPLLSGILTMTMLYSINIRITGMNNVPLFQHNSVFKMLASVPRVLVILGILLLIKLVIDAFLNTEKGYILRATGDNKTLVKSLGKNPDSYILLGLMLSNGLISVSGALMAQHQGFADAQMGVAMIVTAMASIIIGDTIFKDSKKLNFTTRAIIGAIIYRLISGIAIYIGLNPTDLKLVTAVIVIAFIGYNNVQIGKIFTRGDK